MKEYWQNSLFLVGISLEVMEDPCTSIQRTHKDKNKPEQKITILKNIIIIQLKFPISFTNQLLPNLYFVQKLRFKNNIEIDLPQSVFMWMIYSHSDSSYSVLTCRFKCLHSCHSSTAMLGLEGKKHQQKPELRK